MRRRGLPLCRRGLVRRQAVHICARLFFTYACSLANASATPRRERNPKGSSLELRGCAARFNEKRTSRRMCLDGADPEHTCRARWFRRRPACAAPSLHRCDAQTASRGTVRNVRAACASALHASMEPPMQLTRAFLAPSMPAGTQRRAPARVQRREAREFRRGALVCLDGRKCACGRVLALAG